MTDLVGNNILVDVQPKKQDGQKSLSYEDAWLARYAHYWSSHGKEEATQYRKEDKQQHIADM